MNKKENIIGSSWLFDNDTVSNLVNVEQTFTAKECRSIIKLGNSFKSQKAVVRGDNQSVRKSKVSWIGVTEDSKWIFERLGKIIVDLNNKYFNFNIHGIVEAIQFTHYKHPDGKYERHIDRVHNGLVRKLSAVIQLSDPINYEGGQLLIHQGPKPMPVDKKQGTFTIFPSYTLHEVTPVSKGERYSLVVWVNGKPFK